MDDTITMSSSERKASTRKFYALFMPLLLQLEKGVTVIEDKLYGMEIMEEEKDDSHRQCSKRA